jgi:hypothetical protein
MRNPPQPPPPWNPAGDDHDCHQPEQDPVSTVLQVLGAIVGSALVGATVYAVHQLATPALPQQPTPSTKPKKRQQRARPRSNSRARKAASPPPPAPPPVPVDVADYAAAALLGVSVDATPEEITRALRRAVRAKMATGAFHDQPGADSREAAELISAKNRLMERARRVGKS